MSYGLITETDARALENSLQRVAARFPFRTLDIIEVGVCHGDTSRGIKMFLDGQGIAFTYTGIDNDNDLVTQEPFEGACLIRNSSFEAYTQITKRPHWIFCDGCHAANAVMLDFLNYGDLLVPGGEIVLHDAAPRTQNKLDYQGIGPRDHVDFGTATRTACRRLGLLDGARSDWALVEQTWDDADYGGTIVMRKRRDAMDPVTS